MKYLVVHTYLEEGYNPKVVETRCFGSYKQAELAVRKMVNDEKETQLYDQHRETFASEDESDFYLTPIGNEYCYYDWWHIHFIEE